MTSLPRLSVLVSLGVVFAFTPGCLSFDQSQALRTDFGPFDVKVPKDEVISRDVSLELRRQYEDMEARGKIRHD